MTYLETWQLEFRNRSHWPIWFPKVLLTDMDLKSTPSHGSSIPLPTFSWRVRLEISIIFRAWRINYRFREYKLPNKVCHVLFGRSRMVTWPSWPIAPFPHSGLSCGTVQKKSVTVCTMYENYIKFILNCVTKWTGMELETDFVIASIVGTGKSIDLFIC